MTVPLSELSTRPSWLPSVTGLRWWAALLVLGQHIALAASESCPPEGGPVGCTVLSQGFMHGFVGVACFFVISGFVLAWSVDPNDRAPGFLRRRFAKIYPLLLLSNVVDLLINLITGAEPLPSVGTMIANLFVVQAWVPGSELSLQMNQVTWSLSCEVFFYLLFPLIFGWLQRMRTSTLRLVFAGLFVWPAVVFFGAKVVAPESMADPGFASRLLYFWPVTRISEFMIGIVAAVLVKRGAWKGVPVLFAIVLTLGAYVGGIPLLPELAENAPVLGAAMVPFFALLIVSLANADISGRRSFMGSRTMVVLGMISYAMYLFHLFIAQWLSAALSWTNSWEILSNVVTIVVFCTLCAWALFRVVEQPMQHLLSPPRRKPVTPVPEAPEPEPVAVGS
jgi:peptidoglycan/LPS O-acetylase OafA/YrhL